MDNRDESQHRYEILHRGINVINEIYGNMPIYTINWQVRGFFSWRTYVALAVLEGYLFSFLSYKVCFPAGILTEYSNLLRLFEVYK